MTTAPAPTSTPRAAIHLVALVDRGGSIQIYCTEEWTRPAAEPRTVLADVFKSNDAQFFTFTRSNGTCERCKEKRAGIWR